MWVCLVAWWLSAAAAADVDTMALANQAYDNYEFAEAATLYEKAIASGKLQGETAKSNARVKLSFSRYIANDPVKARKALAELFAENPPFVLDRKGIHPDLLKFYDGERSKYPTTAVTPAVVSAPPAAVTSSAPVKYEPAPIILRLLPLGIGQFANGDPVFGGIFLGSELVLVGLNIATALSQGKTCNARNEQCTDIGKETGLFVTQNISAGLIIAVAVFGIVDAILWSPARGEERALNVAIAPHPGGASLVFAKEF